MKTQVRLAIATAAMAMAMVGGLTACGSTQSTDTGSSSPSASGSAATGLEPGSTVRIGAAFGPPFMLKDDKGEWSGFSAELARGFATYAGVTVEFVETTWPTMVAGLQTNKYDFSQPINATEERRKAVDFTNSVGGSGTTFYSKPESGYKTLDDLNKPEVIVAAIAGSGEEEIARKLLPNAQIRSLPSASIADQAIEIQTGRSTVLVNANYAAGALKDSYGFVSTPDVATTPDGIESVEIGMALRQGEGTLMEALNKYIAAITENGELQALRDKWLTVENFLK